MVLASGSPQRSEILRKLGIEFEVIVPGVEELTEGDPEHLVVENARRKARAVITRVNARAPRAGGAVGGPMSEEALATAGHGGSPAATGPARRSSAATVIACDTDVVLDGEVLGKPADATEARAYLDRMSGRAHTVLSGLVVVAAGEERSGLERSTVVFKPLSAAEKERYVAFGEWRGRSGGYAIQTLGSTLVERLEGSVANVVGLPVGLLLELAPQVFTQA